MAAITFRLPRALARALRVRLATEDLTLREWLTREARRLIDSTSQAAYMKPAARSLASLETRDVKRLMAYIDDSLYRSLVRTLDDAGVSVQEWATLRSAIYVYSGAGAAAGTGIDQDLLRRVLAECGLEGEDLEEMVGLINAYAALRLLSPEDVRALDALLRQDIDLEDEDELRRLYNAVVDIPRRVGFALFRRLIGRAQEAREGA